MSLHAAMQLNNDARRIEVGGVRIFKPENKIGHPSMTSSIQRSKTTEEMSGNVQQF